MALYVKAYICLYYMPSANSNETDMHTIASSARDIANYVGTRTRCTSGAIDLFQKMLLLLAYSLI